MICACFATEVSQVTLTSSLTANNTIKALVRSCDEVWFFFGAFLDCPGIDYDGDALWQLSQIP